MADILNKYGYYPSEDEVKQILAEIEREAEEQCVLENYVKCLGSIDLTTLEITDTPESVAHFTNNVNGFREYMQTRHNIQLPNVAAICVYPALVPIVKNTLLCPNVKIASVCGGFPASQTFLDVKLKETQMILSYGADELDIVLSLRAFLNSDNQEAAKEIKAIRKLMDDTGRECKLKVILESGAIPSVELLARASFLALENGADFIKTSTGKWRVSATPEAAVVMCECVKRYCSVTGKLAGFKAAGGIRTAKEAILYMSIAQHILGEDFITPSHFRIGASSLANNLLEKITGKMVSYF